jgi:trehalose 6-phosphate synthase/phosphatase
MKKRLFIISNRLPVNIEVDNDVVNVQPSSGGLVSAISSYLKAAGAQDTFSDIFWVGVPGCAASVWQTAADRIPPGDYHYLPVFINKKIYEDYYSGFSNSVLWPLFHYFPSYAEFVKGNYDNYIQANEIFNDTILNQINANDVIWIHDYHLIPLAGMIREKVPGITIGFFLHIPFPSHEIFKMMPKRWQEGIIRGLLGADLIGFHTIDYASHFLRCIQMILGIDHEMNTVRYDDRLIKIDVFPISIDFQKFYNAYDDKKVAELRTSLKDQFGNKKIIFSVDRLDYTKGVTSRLRAFEYFLKHNKDYAEKVVFILVVVPSRDGISKYAERKKMIDEFISNVNSKIGTINWQPIIYQYTNIDFSELMSFYTACDMALITPLRDGMNLVAKEFVASRKDGKGVLVLSELAGAARELTDAITINPNDIEEISRAIKKGLEMNVQQQAKNMITMQNRLKSYDVNAWAEDFITQLFAIKEKQKDYEIRFIDNETRALLIDQYKNSQKRLFLLDYDGTLLPFSSIPTQAVPGEELTRLLLDLSQNERNNIYVISGRDSNTLDKWLGHLPINIISEHGAMFKIKSKGWEHIGDADNNWKYQVRDIMDGYVKRCVNSFVEVKEYSIAWHYRNANPDQAKIRAAELQSQLRGYINNMGLQIILGNKVIEVRNKGIDKGASVKKILRQDTYDFILACGDDTTDEDMFKELARLPQAFTIKIGSEASYAKYNLHTPQMVISLLHLLAALKDNIAQNKTLVNG